MSQNELTSKIHELRELRRMADEIAAEIDGLTDSIKHKAVTSSRLDTTALKKALPDIAAQYTKTTTSRRFLLA